MTTIQNNRTCVNNTKTYKCNHNENEKEILSVKWAIKMIDTIAVHNSLKKIPQIIGTQIIQSN